jgi:hypothetical protein
MPTYRVVVVHQHQHDDQEELHGIFKVNSLLDLLCELRPNQDLSSKHPHYGKEREYWLYTVAIWQCISIPPTPLEQEILDRAARIGVSIQTEPAGCVITGTRLQIADIEQGDSVTGDDFAHYLSGYTYWHYSWTLIDDVSAETQAALGGFYTDLTSLPTP